MKHLHKFASVLLALVMAFALMAPAFASSGDEPWITPLASLVVTGSVVVEPLLVTVVVIISAS